MSPPRARIDLSRAPAIQASAACLTAVDAGARKVPLRSPTNLGPPALRRRERREGAAHLALIEARPDGGLVRRPACARAAGLRAGQERLCLTRMPVCRHSADYAAAPRGCPIRNVVMGDNIPDEAVCVAFPRRSAREAPAAAWTAGGRAPAARPHDLSTVPTSAQSRIRLPYPVAANALERAGRSHRTAPR